MKPALLATTLSAPSGPIVTPSHRCRHRSRRPAAAVDLAAASCSSGRQQQQRRGSVVARSAGAAAGPAAAPASKTSVSLWTGSDEYTALNDRRDLPPLPLPPLAARKRVLLVRHGQSTWNAEGRIQGSSDLSVLSDKGVAQAQRTRDMVRW